MTTEQSADDTLLSDVFSSGRDRGADPAAPVETPTPEAQESEQKAEPDKPAEPDAKPEGQDDDSKPQGYRDPSTRRSVPLKELTTEREKRQSAEKAREEEARLRKDAEDNWRRTQAQVEEIQRKLQAAQNPPQPPPDPNLDPAGALAHERQTIAQAMLNQRLNFSELLARNKHGDAIVDTALKAATDAGVINEAWVNRSKDFYGDLISWHRRQQVLQRVGDDPDAYEKTLEEKIRAKVLEELKTGNRAVMPGQAPPTQPQFPGTLADVTSTGTNAAQPISDEAVMGSVFGSGRKRK